MSVLITQVSLIETALLKAVKDNPDMSKTEIITVVVDDLGVPRPTVRRVKIDLLIKLQNYVDVLS